jgi:hypothetical protein
MGMSLVLIEYSPGTAPTPCSAFTKENRGEEESFVQWMHGNEIIWQCSKVVTKEIASQDF